MNSNLDVPDATTTVVQYNTEIYDPSGWFNNTTYRWCRNKVDIISV